MRATIQEFEMDFDFVLFLIGAIIGAIVGAFFGIRARVQNSLDDEDRFGPY